MQIINKKTWKSVNLSSAEFICKRRILISDDNPAVHEMLEHDGLQLAYGKYDENTVDMKEHYVVSSVASGGSSIALRKGQIIVEWED